MKSALDQERLTSSAVGALASLLALRPGRLCRHIHVGPLNPDQANRALCDLVGQPVTNAFRGPVPLAEVYQVARKLGWERERPASVEAAP